MKFIWVAIVCEIEGTNVVRVTTHATPEQAMEACHFQMQNTEPLDSKSNWYAIWDDGGDPKEIIRYVPKDHKMTQPMEKWVQIHRTEMGKLY